MKIVQLLTVLSLTILPAQSVFSDDQIENIIVTGTRIPTQISESLSAVTLFQRADIERLQASDLFDLMSHVPGSSLVRNGGRGSSTSMSLRGNQSDHTLFLMDGVRIGSATTGGAALAAINLSTVQRIEIIRGPKSNLYGADAIGGVVNIITRKTESSRVLNVEAGFGSNGTQDTTILLGANGDKYSLTAVLNHLDTDGIDNTESKAGINGDDDGFTKDSMAINYQYQATDSALWKVTYNQNDTKADYDNNCSIGSWPNSSPVDCDIYSSGEVSALASTMDMNISEQWQTSFQIGHTIDEGSERARNIDLSTTNNGGKFNTKKTEATWVNTLGLAAGQALMLGLDYQKEEVDSSTVYNEESRENSAGFAQFQTQLGAVDTNLGVRYDDNEQFGSHTTVSFLAGIDLSETLRLVGSFGEGFKAPTFNDLYYPGFGNASFVPEESKNIEIGLNADLGNVSATLALFNNNIENLIQYNSATFASDQTAEVEITGLEFNVNTEVSGWTLSLSGAVIDPENKSNGKLLRRRAEQSMMFDAGTTLNGVAIGVSVRSESHRYDDAANTVRLGGYTTTAMRASYRINDNWLVKARVNNLTDKNYVTASSFSLGNYMSLGREAMITVAYTPFK
ncbi:MAG: Vitamin B12 transporter BtuB [Porticoccaceae bacterium UBA1117]|jgi:vitamin B12 transporter|nr:TonB-dependent receptor [Porticoccaceae bacterium]CAI8275956.1 MAG: Vitamin B12 transporter BtuB [Porticoccaceae bacterium UBA1117]